MADERWSLLSKAAWSPASSILRPQNGPTNGSEAYCTQGPPDAKPRRATAFPRLLRRVVWTWSISVNPPPFQRSFQAADFTSIIPKSHSCAPLPMNARSWAGYLHQNATSRWDHLRYYSRLKASVSSVLLDSRSIGRRQ